MTSGASRGAQRVHAGDGGLGRRQPEGRPVEHRLGRPGDEHRDHRGPLRQRGGRQRPDLLRLPRGQRDRRPPGEVLLEQLQRLRVGVRRAVLAGLEAGVRAHQDHGLVGLAGDGLARLGADGVQARGDVAERRHEGAVGRAHAEVVAVGGDAAEDAGDGVLADAAHREQASLRVRARVPEAAGEAVGDGVHAGRPHEVGGGDEERRRRWPPAGGAAPGRARRAAW